MFGNVDEQQLLVPGSHSTGVGWGGEKEESDIMISTTFRSPATPERKRGK